MNIILIGYRCSGKTVVGKAVAERLNRVFIDSDDYLEFKAGRSIERIVNEEGWDYFRDLEKKVIDELSGQDNLVIATGGGVVTNEENIERLKQNGLIIWLQAKAVILKDRMDNDQSKGKKRPSLTGQDPVGEIKNVLDQRSPLYEQAADLAIETSSLSIAQTVDNVIEMLPQQ
jgi:shikimate kinase